jgi:hypothetical protein
VVTGTGTVELVDTTTLDRSICTSNGTTGITPGSGSGANHKLTTLAKTNAR